MTRNLQIVGRKWGRWNYERSELQAERDEVFDDRQVLGNGPGEGAWCWVLGAWCEGSETEVEPRAAGGEEGEVNGRDAVATVGAVLTILV